MCETPLEERECRIKLPHVMEEKVLRKGGYRCRRYGDSKDDGIELNIDNIIPLADEGTNNLDNLQTLQRGDENTIYFYKQVHVENQNEFKKGGIVF